MCGRYALYGPISRHREQMPDEATEWWPQLADAIDARKPRYNFAPTQVSPVVGVGPTGITIRDLRWGLVPGWAKDVKIGYKAINARAETVAEKPMFRSAFKSRRCLVPARGYFEWQGDKPPKQPYYIHPPAGDLLLFAGLWESWRPEMDAEPLHTYTIVTGPPGLVSGDIHDRAPVILPPELWHQWLTADPAAALDLLQSVPEPKLTYHPVDRAVGAPKNDRAELVEPIEA